jgi:hypothetical protein
LIDRSVRVSEIDDLYREMGLDEPFFFPWYNGSDKLVGAVTGFIRYRDGHKHLDVDHMIMSPRAERPLVSKMQMSEAATQRAFDNGCAYILIAVFLNDPRLSGLSAWAKRMKFKPWADSDDSRWFIRFNERYIYDNGQGREGSCSEAATGGSRPERG